MSVKKYYLFANWKMYLDYDESNILANAIAGERKKIPANVEMAIFCSALSFYAVAQVLNDVNIGVGLQNGFHLDKGGYTGEISFVMYKNAGAKYALIGHSERRHQFHESDHDVRQKIEAALIAGLIPVICIGETEKEREVGKTEEVLEVQLRAALGGLSWPVDRELIVAYEPVWAIGTGNACSPDEAGRLHKKIAGWIKGLQSGTIPILLYGGSVRPDNVASYLALPNIRGVLVGGAAAKLESWMEIVKNISE